MIFRKQMKHISIQDFSNSGSIIRGFTMGHAVPPFQGWLRARRVTQGFTLGFAVPPFQGSLHSGFGLGYAGSGLRLGSLDSGFGLGYSDSGFGLGYSDFGFGLGYAGSRGGRGSLRAIDALTGHGLRPSLLLSPVFCLLSSISCLLSPLPRPELNRNHWSNFL
jgi:hypothetical protein